MDIEKNDYVRNTQTDQCGQVLYDPIVYHTSNQTMVTVQVRGLPHNQLWHAASCDIVTFLHCVKAGDCVGITDNKGHYGLATVIHVHRNCEWASVDYNGREIIVWAEYIVRYIPANVQKGA